ncbi:hypothetical protein D9757_007669 [Collybiopsis confluens]|uniref:Uncharacterized protein n=1 Tax=Collybiopsis confluens TaxID=2823264 RepID=A0A8H5H9A3_9AGAR|nr:hypothetical protein D9757_007669 [Collybiopsis confluens]
MRGPLLLVLECKHRIWLHIQYDIGGEPLRYSRRISMISIKSPVRYKRRRPKSATSTTSTTTTTTATATHRFAPELSKSSTPFLHQGQHIMAGHALRTRRLPNEMFYIIIGNLGDDRDITSLRNTSLVCHDFARTSRAQIYREINLEEDLYVASTLHAFDRFCDLLREPQTAYIGRYVQILHTGGSIDDSSSLDFILRNLPSLKSFKIKEPTPRDFQVMQSRLGEKTASLRVEFVTLYDSESFQIFRTMIESLKGLKILTLVNILTLNSHPKTILPRSLEVLSLSCMGGDLAGLIAFEATTRNLSLKTLTVRYADATYTSSLFWETFGSETMEVALDVSVPGLYFPDLMRQTKVVLSCFQQREMIEFFTTMIPEVPEKLDEICIDFNPSSESIDPKFALPGGRSDYLWAELDKVLAQRHRQGMLKRLCFRCTKRDHLYNIGGSLSPTTDAMDRAILSRIRTLLPVSSAEPSSFVEVDSDTKVYEPRF